MFKISGQTFIIVFLWAVSCKQITDIKPPTPSQNTLELKLTDREVILNSLSDYNSLGLLNATSYELSSEHIFTITKIIKQAIEDGKFNFLNTPSVETIWHLFYLQYVPYLDDNGQKIVLLNAICNDSKVLEPIYYINEVTKTSDTLLWSDFFIDMRDGGPCYWSLKINLDTMKYLELSVNGY